MVPGDDDAVAGFVVVLGDVDGRGDFEGGGLETALRVRLLGIVVVREGFAAYRRGFRELKSRRGRRGCIVAVVVAQRGPGREARRRQRLMPLEEAAMVADC